MPDNVNQQTPGQTPPQTLGQTPGQTTGQPPVQTPGTTTGGNTPTQTPDMDGNIGDGGNGTVSRAELEAAPQAVQAANARAAKAEAA